MPEPTRTVYPGDLPAPVGKQRFYTPADVAKHNSGHDCWVSYAGKVKDLTPLLAAYTGPLSEPIIVAAGTDISHWFDESKKENIEPKRFIHPDTGLEAVYCPQGRYIHVPPVTPDSNWYNDFETPWWRDEKYTVGKLASATIKIRALNLLTKQSCDLEVPVEETINEIQVRYNKYNQHAGSYVWKRLGMPLDMQATLEDNGVKDDSAELLSVGIDPDDHVPVLHLYFSDDLTEA
jgi:hypothetical protein